MSWNKVTEDMMSCEQTKGLSVYEHGNSVYDWYSVMKEILAYGYHDPANKSLIGKDKFKLPDWWFKYEEDIAWSRHSSNVMYWYTRYHDCGKPYCLEVDDSGVSHFPEHAKKSYDTWMELIKIPNGQVSFSRITSVGNNMEKTKGEIIGDLILHDMAIHTMKASDIEPLIEKLGKYTVISLLLAAICEIHSNAEMFGGTESQSFKIKWKQINRRGKAICKRLFGEKNEELN